MNIYFGTLGVLSKIASYLPYFCGIWFLLSQIVLFDLFRTALLRVFQFRSTFFNRCSSKNTRPGQRWSFRAPKERVAHPVFFELLPDGDRLSLFFFSNFSILTLYILASTIQQIENRPTVAVRRLGLTKAPHHHLSTSYAQPDFISKI